MTDPMRRPSGSLPVSAGAHSTERPAQDLEHRIRALGSWFHNITLDGVKTAPDHFLGDYPTVKWRRFAHAIPSDLRGWSVLDIGCNGGFYCLEMKRRGADRVVGVDTDARYLAQAQFAAEVAGQEIEYVQSSVYELASWRERFDLVLFLGVLYHLRHPLLALDILHDHVVGRLLVFQSMLRGSPDVAPLAENYDFSETAPFDEPGYPRLHFVERRYAGDVTNWWVPNRACAEAMLRSSGFGIVSHPETEVYVCEPRTCTRPTDEELTWLKR
jgi:tRNA (mo5U34)-methyltransferase